MHTSTAALFVATLGLGAVVSAAPAKECGADNCLRALRATNIPNRLQSAQAFCASYTGTAQPRPTVPGYASEACPSQNGKASDARISSACGCLPQPTPTVTPSKSSSAAPPSSTQAPTQTPVAAACAQVSSSYASQIKATPGVAPTVAASVAYDCAKSIPLGQQDASEVLDAIEPFLEWQSDPGDLKNPPDDYFWPSLDLDGTLKDIRSKVKANSYKSHYDFEADLQKRIFMAAHDGHFGMKTRVVGRVFTYNVPQPLVSISEDGVALPSIKLYNDVLTSPSTASAIDTINGVDAAEYLDTLITTGSYLQGADGSYNNLFHQANYGVAHKGGFASGGRHLAVYQGANTTFAFTNGTVLTVQNGAAVRVSFNGVTDGPSAYKAFVPLATSAKRSVSLPEAEDVVSVSDLMIRDGPAAAAADPYPKPIIASPDNVVRGFYLEGAGLDHVGVLTIASFAPKNIPAFQSVVHDFLVGAKHDGKTKIILDLSGNPGGYILLGYELFHQFFPQNREDGFSRWRANPAFQAIAKTYSDFVEDLDPFNSADDEKINIWESWFNYKYDLNVTHQNFLSFDKKFTPQYHEDTPYTSLMAWNLSDPLSTTNATYGFGIDFTGYGKLKNATQYFSADDLVVLYDGDCSSTCTLTSAELRTQKVKSVAIGGRPQNGPMQGVGGVKGAQVLNSVAIQGFAVDAAKKTNNTKFQTEFARYSTPTVNKWISTLGVSLNTRDAIIPEHIEDGIASQFVAEYSDCHIFWTPATLNSVSEIWKATAKVAFQGAKCAHGSINRKLGASAASIIPVPEGPKPDRLTDQIDLNKVDPKVVDPNWLQVHSMQRLTNKDLF